MKVMVLLLSLLTLALNTVPCSDGVSQNVEMSDEGGSNTDDQAEDDCSPLCTCSCCGISISFQETNFDIQIEKLFFTTHLFNYSQFLKHGFTSLVWHPPTSNYIV